MNTVLNRRRPRRRPPQAAPAPVVQQPDPQPDAEASYTPKSPRPFATTVTRYYCPTCEAPVPLQNVSSEMKGHPSLSTIQREITVECICCGDTNVAKLALVNGEWQMESVTKRELKRSA